MWHIKTFDELSNREIWAIYRARIAVFVVDQHSEYQDVDEQDLTALHVFYEENGELLAYARVFEKDQDTVTFGRVLTVRQARGKGFGKALIQQLMDVMATRFDQDKIEIEAQEHAVGLYERFGFEVYGDTFLDVGVPHKMMVAKNQKKTAGTEGAN
ncbi:MULTISPECIES: GNAT family N-acetyltransferase [Fructobacillus]|jgi:ElaA protein|uniref:GNAT family (ElaA) n=1 Tax=Fructobacillus cardui TaxID=2893170 RepID=A0ABN9Z247_9LACO|nr:GNAT family N-acetyltransferase [Fructobacillus sp. EFB-N1]KMK53745.1 Spermine/spermidine acetyltransferase [Fructobacillus sp. EFB-N1]CAK1222426.1 GNAT family (ElaA) [Fructobacillus cardui]CAK1246322.1 GNAT family (ElaA) [Fructobacillus cardui]CAK1251420.1 GNAT family (ElaA) [Fructobacillus cardui]